MLMIKLSKIGKTNKKIFRLIISEKGRDPYGRSLEVLGSYNPYSKNLEAKTDRIKYWLDKGAGMTASVNNLLVGKGVIEGNKVTASKPGKANEKKVAQAKAKTDKKSVSEPVNAPATSAEKATTSTDTEVTVENQEKKAEAKA